MFRIPAAWMRGGTSKCWVFEWDNLQVPGKSVDEVLLRLFGSPDNRQIDGVGGGTSTTSKAVILSRSASAEADVDYTFAQVAVEEHRVDWGSNCGNCSAVVAPYAIDRGWVDAGQETTSVRTLNTNTDQLILQKVSTPDGRLQETGTLMIPGVPFPGLSVGMGFFDPAGRTTGKLFPTGEPVEKVTFDGREIPATLIDAGAPLIILEAASVGLTGNETAGEIDGQAELLVHLDDVRRDAAVRMGLAATRAEAERAIPKLALVARPSSDEGADLVVRMLSMGKLHPALAITGSVALTMAAQHEGTVVRDLISTDASSGLAMRTPAGLVQTWAETRDGVPVVGTLRSARRLADAELLLPETW
ncbi:MULTISPECIES: PrpF domain-containing protein [Micrococcaceae]|uniref:PrpF domain-containing protein n=1 Tax=Micrococcaceae TaxID=1268 RepID=UPI0012F7752F|nr:MULTISPECIES: PrpF domain-containing protein [Pseudarthrobacter]MEA3551289.1 PrpF domain-containing protein [Pseudarthrobacter sp. C1]MUU71990.1 methylitaconate delta2-delta3-isomerase [Pseudarthrobacter sp. GA104]WPU09012.1 PrpF domain-containing protein [Pseudarthrobacter oxydans]HET7781764.1 PrpF domain-containing protein [Arthrobacter sp.]